MKKTLQTLLFASIAMLMPLGLSAHDFEVGGIYYNITSEEELTVAVTYRGNSNSEYSNEYTGAVTIPTTVTYNSKTYSVTSIGSFAFYGCSSLTAITIPDGVTSIGGGAFYRTAWYDNQSDGVIYIGKVLYEYKGTMPANTSIEVKEGTVSISPSAFRYCSSLTTITIPESVTSIGEWAFENCSSLTSITLPEGVTSIGDYAFYGCSSLTAVHISSLEAWCNIDFSSSDANPLYYAKNLYINGELVTELAIPNSVTAIKDYAFYGCSSLTSITLPEGVTSIGKSAFYGCYSLTAITIPEGVTSIGGGAFSGCSSLKSITIPEGVTSIGGTTFSDCSSLTAITIPEGVTSIGECAFEYCSSLTTITLPEGVTSIGDYAFRGCSSLYKVFNCSNLSLSKGLSNYGYVAYYAKVVYQGGECTTVDNFQFYASNGIHSLVNYIGNDTEIVLPDSYNGENYKIGDYAFYNCSLTTITLPEGVTSIGNYAFCNCSRLTSITIPEGVTSIGNCAFDNCTALKKVIIEDGSSTLSLGYNSSSQGLFYDCPLEEVYLGRNLSYLSYSSGSSGGYSPFYNKDALTNVAIGNEVTQISEDAFYGCDNIHSLTISSGVLSIGSNAFSTPEKVIWLTNTPPTGYTNAKGSINYVANNQHSSLSNLKVYPYLSSMFEVGGVKYVPVSPSERTCHAIDCVYGDGAATINVGETTSFKGIAMTVKEVMPYTFYGNKHIKEVNISHKGNIGNYAFYDCDSVQSVELSNEGNVGSQAFYDCDGMLTATISNQGNIESQAFYDCDGIKSLDISNIGYVGDEAFRGCGALETAIVANTGAVNSSAFYDCVSLKSATLGDKVTSLGNDAFRGCTSLQEIVIPNSVKWVGTYCFYGCTVMKSAVIGDGLTNVKEYTFANCGLEKIIIGDNITSIGNYAFKECRGMKSAVLGNGLTKVNGTMFNGCIGLENVEIGNKVTELEANAFSGCSSLKDVKIGSGVATINNYAFQGCSSLPTITIPQAVTKIGDNVFVGCSKLADVIIADRSEPLALGSNGSSPLFVDCPLDSVYIGGKITYSTTSNMGYSPFYLNTSLRTVVITDREDQIYANEFYGCTNLQNVTIGNGVKSIGNYAFSGCSSLEGFSFGSNMESIGAEAFSDCTNLTSLTSYAAAPPTCGSQALDDINKWNCTLYIPTGSLAAYMTADQWKEFFFIEDNVTDGIEDIIMNDKQIDIIYDLQGRRVLNTDNLKGIYIINGKKTIK